METRSRRTKPGRSSEPTHDPHDPLKNQIDAPNSKYIKMYKILQDNRENTAKEDRVEREDYEMDEAKCNSKTYTRTGHGTNIRERLWETLCSHRSRN